MNIENQKNVSKLQIELLGKRIRYAEETEAAKELKEYLLDLKKTKRAYAINIMVVGEKDSYAAAVFATYSIPEKFKLQNVEAATAQTAFQQYASDEFTGEKPKYDLVIGISYTGRTSDMKDVSKVCQERGYPFILLTGTEKSELSDFYEESKNIKIISYFNPKDTTGRENGMISMASTLIPIVILDENLPDKLIDENQDCLKSSKNFVSDLKITEMTKKMKKNEYPVVYVFYEEDTLPVAIDLERKFMDAGISYVLLHDKMEFLKDSFYVEQTSVVINLCRHYNFLKKMNAEENQINSMIKEMCEKKPVSYIELGSSSTSTSQWNVETMFKIPYLVTAFGKELKA